MKLYAVMRKNCRRSWRSICGWLGTSADQGMMIFVRKKDAKDYIGEHDHLEVVTFECTDKGKDARKRETWAHLWYNIEDE